VGSGAGLPSRQCDAPLHGVTPLSKSTTNIAASVRQRLLNRAREKQEDFALLLTKYALERVLYRLSQSEYERIFVLKGALLFELWTEQTHRPTRDADFLGQGDNDPGRLEAIFRNVCALSVENDGLVFDPSTVKAQRIKEDEDYEGVRITFLALLDRARIPIQIDIGFGDIITPAPQKAAFPTLLDSPQPVLLTYPRETVVAEKFEAMVKLGITNSRMKDFYDLCALAELFSFDGGVLLEAIQKTFERRKTPLPTAKQTLFIFTPAFYEDEMKNRQWNAFVTKNRLNIRPISLRQAISDIERFLWPLLTATAIGTSERMTWPANGPWT
jgi:Nucleotidyl transferase AbiEii toxin, Type IV TA system